MSRAIQEECSTLEGRPWMLDSSYWTERRSLTPFHVAGLVEPFDVRLLEGAELYLRVPSPYSGGVSYVLDVETRDAHRDPPGVTVGADGLTLDLVAKTPLPLEGSVLVGGRLLHALQEAITEPIDSIPLRRPAGAGRVGTDGRPSAPYHDVSESRGRMARSWRRVGTSPEASWGNRAISAGYEGVVGRVEL